MLMIEVMQLLFTLAVLLLIPSNKNVTCVFTVSFIMEIKIINISSLF